MDWWLAALLAGSIATLALGIAAFVLWRSACLRTKALGARLGRLTWRRRLKLAWRLARDRRVPLAVRAIPPLLVAYLAMPLDIVPDFVPVLGQIDDVAVMLIAVSLVARFVPLEVVDEHLSALEAETALPT